VTHVVSQSDVVKLLWANKSVLADSLTQTVEQLELDDVSVTQHVT
jgi:DNA-binding winged helix-turn-helix (wHTH) protein